MKTDKEKTQSPDQTSDVQLLGQLTASATHELRNTYSIIQESIGLLNDRLSVEDLISDTHKEYIGNCAQSLRQQIKRGSDLITSLNTLANSPNRAESSVEVRAAIQHMVNLLRRFASFQQLSLEVTQPDHPIEVEIAPFKFYKLIVFCVHVCFNMASVNDRIDIDLSVSDQQVLTQFRIQPVGTKTPPFETDVNSLPAWIQLSSICDETGGALSLDSPRNQFTVALPRFQQ